MESMVIKTIWLAQFDFKWCFEIFGAFVQQTLSIIVGNQHSCKKPSDSFQPRFNGQAFDRLHENAGSSATDIISLEQLALKL
jgi:hypothetical protein